MLDRRARASRQLVIGPLLPSACSMNVKSASEMRLPLIEAAI
jgi:hypothetical protein